MTSCGWKESTLKYCISDAICRHRESGKTHSVSQGEQFGQLIETVGLCETEMQDTWAAVLDVQTFGVLSFTGQRVPRTSNGPRQICLTARTYH